MKTKISSKIITAFLAIALSALSAFCFVIPAKTVKAETDNTPENVKTADVFMIAGQSNAAGSTRANSTKYGYEVTYRREKTCFITAERIKRSKAEQEDTCAISAPFSTVAASRTITSGSNSVWQTVSTKEKNIKAKTKKRLYSSLPPAELR